jgi:hypothetical protein
MPHKLRSTALALVLLLASSAVQARPLTGRLPPEDLFAAFWSRLVSLFVPAAPADQTASSRSQGEKAGSQMDPNGCHLNGTSCQESTSNAGSQMDPDGQK